MKQNGVVCQPGPALLFFIFRFEDLISGPKSYRDFRETGPRPKKLRIQWGRWDCKSKEITVGILSHVEFLKLNKEARVWKIIITRLFGRHLSLRATRLATAFIRTSYTISRGSITLREFPLVKARKSLVFACENSLHF